MKDKVLIVIRKLTVSWYLQNVTAALSLTTVTTASTLEVQDKGCDWFWQQQNSLKCSNIRRKSGKQVLLCCKYSHSVLLLGLIDCLQVRPIKQNVVQPYQMQVRNVFVMGGNVAVLKCNIPNFLRGLVQVSSWLKDEHLLGRTVIHPGGKFTLTSSGSLHIRDTVTNDGFARFYCQTVHRLTGEKKLSMPGQIIISRELR
ncbi:Down syndrome cell adhesion molecule homolog isoform X5 [Zootermopsis nevadensis]|uniref:Down syndrome cell adhesion molecule homolog isoform X5 n=1 Tax=Zootermopsis nevadensis TaxID=136037 RepID=UPI000B8ED0D5|nr:Down syndrome cell adhesion molecule homolog isoform X5 [Zootermopsis nevadensis]